MEIPRFEHPLELEFLRHGRCNSKSEAGSDMARTHTDWVKQAFERIREKGPILEKANLYLCSPARRASELTRFRKRAARCDTSPMEPYCDYCGGLGAVLPELYPSENDPLGVELVQIEQECQGCPADGLDRSPKIFKEFGERAAVAIFDQCTRRMADLKHNDGLTMRTVIASHMFAINTFVWAIIEGRVSDTEKRLVLGTALQFCEGFLVTITPGDTGVSVSVKHIAPLNHPALHSE